MRSKLICAGILALLLPFFVAKSASAQANYAALEDHPRYLVGGGISGFNMDWGHGKMFGPTIWADWNPPFMPSFLGGLGIELEARDMSWHRSSTQPPDFRTDTIGGGLIYHHRVPGLRRIHSLQPFAKGEWLFGSIDHGRGVVLNPVNPTNPAAPTYNHETRTVTEVGGGFDYKLPAHLTARAEFDYQFWPQIYSTNSDQYHTLDPAGVTLGVLYRFGGRGRY